MNKQRITTKQLALCSVLLTLMLVLGWVESLFPPLLGVPGIKLGLSNGVLIFAVYMLSLPTAWVLMLLKVVLSSLFLGGVAALPYALAGGVLSLASMCLLSRMKWMHPVTVSIVGGVMEVSKPPIRVICPGRVYRNEAISYRAHCFFHQVEGLYIDKNVSFTDLKQVLLQFAQEMFGPETKIRLRPSYFPFTEPSAEMDISCDICGGEGCPFCKYTGWVEILGCGMVDPAVLEANGIDSKVYTGYAFGMGVERIANLKYKVKDLRMFSENDTRFLEEFEAAN